MTDDLLPVEAPPQGQPSWLVSFADLISLLLCFFVMLFAMSSVEVARWQNLAQSLARPRAEGGSASTSDASEPWAKRPGRAVRGAVADDGSDLDYLAAIFQRRIDEGSILDGIKLSRMPDHLVISLAASVFDRGRTVVNPNARLMVATLGAVLGNIRNQVDVRGHGEPTAISKAQDITPAQNWEMSLARAASVASELQRGGFLREPLLVGLGDARSQPAEGLQGGQVDIIVRAWKARGRS